MLLAGQEITIPDELQVGRGTGYSLWPSSTFLAEFLVQTLQLKGKSIVELGCGLAVPSIVLARLGNKVTCIDLPEMKPNIGLMMRANKIASYSWIGLNWHVLSSEWEQVTGADLFVSADIFYEESDFSAIVRCVSFLLNRNPTASFLTCLHLRDPYSSISLDLRLWNLQARLLQRRPPFCIIEIEKTKME